MVYLLKKEKLIVQRIHFSEYYLHRYEKTMTENILKICT